MYTVPTGIHLLKGLKELCTVHLNEWLDDVDSKEGGRSSRDLQYCLGSRVGGLRWEGLDL